MLEAPRRRNFSLAVAMAGLLVPGAMLLMGGCGGSSDKDGGELPPGQEVDAGSGDAQGHEDGAGSGADAGDSEDSAEDRCGSVSCERGMICSASTGECGCFGEICGEGTSCDATAEACVVDAPEACLSGDSVRPWVPGEQAFRDASADWGLDEIDPRGTRLSVVDVDQDGWADLSIRTAGITPATPGDDFAEGGSRKTWLLKNSGASDDNSSSRVFEDITRASGLMATRDDTPDMGRRVDLIVWGDVDNDGFVDAYTAYIKGPKGSGDTAELMLNNGDGTFRFAAEDSALRNASKSDAPGGASFVDIDRDGNLDLWVTQGAANGSPLQDQLFEGDGSGKFEEITRAAGLTTRAWMRISDLNEARAHTNSWGALACDLNGDGTPELLSASYGRAPNHLWRGEPGEDGAVNFVNESIASGYAFDENTDWSDNESARCYCKINPNATDCAGVPEPQYTRCDSAADILRWDHTTDREPFRLGGNSGTSVCADLNNDGWMDLLTTEIVHWDVGGSSDPSEILYNLQDDAVRFERPGNEATGLTREHDRTDWNDGDITAAVFDFDNDGRKDIYIGSTDYPGTRGLLWHQKPDGTFEPVSLADGIDHKSSHGVAVADFNRDGTLDLAVGHSRNRCSSGDHCYEADQAHVRLFENLAGKNNNWLQIALEGGEGTNRRAIGARVSVETDELTQTQSVDGGHGHYGVQHDLVQHFGLGAACTARVTVRWPDQPLTEETFVLRAGHRYEWVQGQTPTLVE